MYLQPKFFQWHPVLSRPSMDDGEAGLPSVRDQAVGWRHQGMCGLSVSCHPQ